MKLYIFGIGGTGSRVLKSLTMLLAAGVKCGADTIVPVIIDRDTNNGDFTRTHELIQRYIAINEIAAKTDKNRFFRTKIEMLEVDNNTELCLKLKDEQKKFDEFIGKREMSYENQALVEMLFSEETLGMDMTVGFQGNPNVGSVVLNQFENSNVFTAFANDFNKDRGDKIFIISSIFGGTGASGFPLLRRVLHTKNVKTANGQELINWGQINEAPLGAITVLPYFSVKEKKVGDDSYVDANTFIDKAKAALSYYVTEDKHLDTMYYIGDKNVSTYEHEKGGIDQRNNAHFVELAAALAVLDFVNPDKKAANFHRNNNEILGTAYKEFGIISNGQAGDVPVIGFSNLADETKRTLINPLTRFLLFRKYLKKEFKKQYRNQPYARKDMTHTRFNDEFMNNENIQKLERVQDIFFEWLQEMESQNRQFAPFILEDDDTFNFIRGNINVVRKSLLYRNWALLDNELNRQATKLTKEELTDEERFLELFYRATEKVINFKN